MKNYLLIISAKKTLRFDLEISEEMRLGKPEHPTLTLDSAKARTLLSWKDRVSFEDAVRFSLDLGRELRKKTPDSVWETCIKHLDDYYKN
jgi:GDP-D-mannose dehydratase